MTQKRRESKTSAELRHQAEAMALEKPRWPQALTEIPSSEATQQMLHELHVHQIELELQNEELRRAQVELETARELYFGLYELAPVGYCTLDLEGLILLGNLTLATLLGVARKDLIGQPFHRFIYREDQDVYYLHRKRLVGSGEPLGCELRMVKDDGMPFWVNLAATVARDADDVTMHRLVVSDIGERKLAEKQFRDAQSNFTAEILRLNSNLERVVDERTAALKTANRELTTFTYAISHDLKAPLRGIDGYSRLLLDEHRANLNPEGQRFLASIRDGAQEMERLIEDLLAYSRLERGVEKQCQTSLRDVALRDIAQEVISQFSGEFEKRQVRLNLSIPSFEVKVDSEALSMILRNLLDNALKFTRYAAQPAIDIGWKETPGGCILWVRDNGIGFDMKFHDRIFGIFQRLEHAEDYPGTGVGLALVQKGATQVGGKVWAESEPGKGATFYLELPK